MTQVSSLVTTTVGKPLYNRMKEGFDYGQILWTMARYNQNMSKEEAERLLDAFLQWVSIVPLNENGYYVTMFQTPVEEAFHCFVLNTRLYKKFCEEFLGFFFHHDPLVQEPGEAIVRAAKFSTSVPNRREHLFMPINTIGPCLARKPSRSGFRSSPWLIIRDDSVFFEEAIDSNRRFDASSLNFLLRRESSFSYSAASLKSNRSWS